MGVLQPAWLGDRACLTVSLLSPDQTASSFPALIAYFLLGAPNVAKYMLLVVPQ